MTDIQQKLFKMQDLEYKKFHSGLMPQTNPDTIIGVRTPLIRSMIKELDIEDVEKFLNSKLPHLYYEENNLHVFLISKIKNYDDCINELEKFLPYIDNWATCDSLRPVCFNKNKDNLLIKIDSWIKSRHTYTVRFAIEMLMIHFLDKDFQEDYLTKVAQIKSDEYYVNMMIAWYFATALAKQYNSTVKILENRRLSTWIHNKTIQKALESFRITDEQKKYLRSLKTANKSISLD